MFPKFTCFHRWKSTVFAENEKRGGKASKTKDKGTRMSYLLKCPLPATGTEWWPLIHSVITRMHWRVHYRLEGKTDLERGIEQICALTFISPSGTFTTRCRLFGKSTSVKICSRQFLIFITTNDLWKRLPERPGSPQVVESRSLDNYLSSSTNSPNNPGLIRGLVILIWQPLGFISNYDEVSVSFSWMYLKILS